MILVLRYRTFVHGPRRVIIITCNEKFSTRHTARMVEKHALAETRTDTETRRTGFFRCIETRAKVLYNTTTVTQM